MAPKKILITGVAGYIGDAVVGELIRRNPRLGSAIHGVDRLLYGQNYLPPNIFFKNVDIRSYDFELLLEDLRPDVIIHLAAIVGDGACNVDEFLTRDINVYGSKFIVDWCKSSRSRLVFASTCSVYGYSQDYLDEDSATTPISLYAETKLEVERYIREKLPYKHTILRFGTIGGMSGPFGRIRTDLVANKMTIDAIKKDSCSVFGGDQWRPMVSVNMAGEAAALSALLGNANGTFIISDKNYKLKDLAIEILGDKKSNLIEQDMPTEDLRNYKVINKKAIEAGLIVRSDFSAALVEMRDVFSSGRISDLSSPAYHNERYLKMVIDELA